MLKTAAELWREWTKPKGPLRPGGYDRDVADFLRAELTRQGHSAQGTLATAMGTAGWDARDLLRALAPVVASFSGMQRDLLRLLERIGVSSGDGDDLRVEYEFEEGDVLDDTIAAFREKVRRTERFVTQVQPWHFDDDNTAWAFPLDNLVSREWIDDVVTGAGHTDWRDWEYERGVPDPKSTGDAKVDGLAGDILALVRFALVRLLEVGTSRRDAYDGAPDDEQLRRILQAASDNWPLWIASAVHEWCARVTDGSLTADDRDTLAIERWLEAMRSDDVVEVSIEREVDDLLDILRLPTWGKRHELYSAWITTQIDRALAGRLSFVVNDGALRFPFVPTAIARLDAHASDVELICEMRSHATNLMGKTRKSGVQPDYRFHSATADTLVAVEVKQYASASASTHAKTMHDYVVNLPRADVFIVGHGPLGTNLARHLSPPDDARAHAYEHVRPGRARDAARFRDALSAALPTPRIRRPTRIELRWPTASDLDLHVSSSSESTHYDHTPSAHSSLRADVRAGGGTPEVVDLVPGWEGRLDVQVDVYTRESIAHSRPVVTFVFDDESTTIVTPREGSATLADRRWHVGSVENDGSIVLAADSVVVDPGSFA